MSSNTPLGTLWRNVPGHLELDSTSLMYIYVILVIQIYLTSIKDSRMSPKTTWSVDCRHISIKLRTEK